MKKLRTALVFLPLFFQFQTSFGCDCAPSPDNFCQSLRYNEHVALVKVISKNGAFMDVVILEQLHNTFAQDTITVIGQDGLNCAQDLGFFNPNDTLILGLQDWDMVDTFNLSACGLYYLTYSSGQVSGSISPVSTSESYQEFEAGLAACSPLQVPNVTRIEPISISIQNRQYTIVSPSDQINALRVFDLRGALIYTSARAHSTSILFDATGLQAGIYLFEVQRESGISVWKQALQ